MSKKFSHSTIQALSTVSFNCKKQKKLLVPTGFVFEAFYPAKDRIGTKDCHFLCPRTRPDRPLVPGRDINVAANIRSSSDDYRQDGKVLIKEGKANSIQGWAQFLFCHYVVVPSLTTFTETKDLVIQRLTLWAQYLELIPSWKFLQCSSLSLIAWSRDERQSPFKVWYFRIGHSRSFVRFDL